MNKNKKILDLTGFKYKNNSDNKNISSNIHTIQPDKKRTFDINFHTKLKENDFKDITNIVRNSVEKINNLFNQTEFQTKNKYGQKTSKELKFEICDIDECEELNKSSEIKKNERSNTLEKSSKTNFTFNINNFINVPNISTALPNMSQINQDKNINAGNLEKKNLKSAAINSKNNRIYLNNINNKKNMLMDHKAFPNKKIDNEYEKNNNQNNSMNDSLFQIDEIQTENDNNNKKTKIKDKINTNSNVNSKVSSKNSQKNIKISVGNSRANKASNININKTELSKSIKEVKESGSSTPLHNDNTINMTLSGLTIINPNKKVLYKMPNKKKSEKENSNLNTAQKPKNNHTLNRPNKYKLNHQNNNNYQNKTYVKRNDLFKNKQFKNKAILSKSKKILKTGENFFCLKNDKEKVKNEYKNELNVNESINNKIKNENFSENYNITVKTMDDINNKKFKKNSIGNISERVSLANSPKDSNNETLKRRGGSIPFERRKSDMQEKDGARQSSSRLFHQVVNVFYSKEFPNKINTNEILKLMLFLNEYLINNNLLNDYYNNENKKLLDDYSKFISSKIKVDFPQEHDIVVDPSIKCVKKIQRKWRKRKIEKYLEKNQKSEENELKHMIVNRYIKKSGYKVKKILGLFNTIVENFDNINKQPDINELFYQIQKLIHNKLTVYEKNLLYKEFINSVIFNNNK